MLLLLLIISTTNWSLLWSTVTWSRAIFFWIMTWPHALVILGQLSFYHQIVLGQKDLLVLEEPLDISHLVSFSIQTTGYLFSFTSIFLLFFLHTFINIVLQNMGWDAKSQLVVMCTVLGCFYLKCSQRSGQLTHDSAATSAFISMWTLLSQTQLVRF